MRGSVGALSAACLSGHGGRDAVYQHIGEQRAGGQERLSAGDDHAAVGPVRICAFMYVSAGPGESTTDAVFGGHVGDGRERLPAEKLRAVFVRRAYGYHRNSTCIASRTTVSCANTFISQMPAREFRRVRFSAQAGTAGTSGNRRTAVSCRSDRQQRDIRCRRGVQHTGDGTCSAGCATLDRSAVVIGVSGGLDSALALMVASKAMQRTGLKKNAVIGVVMPGFGSTEAKRRIARAPARTCNGRDAARDQHRRRGKGAP